MEYSLKFDKNGEMVFATDSMAFTFKKAKKFYMETGTFFKMTIEEQPKYTTDNQIKLFERLCFLVSDETGDSFQNVKKNLTNNFLPEISTGNKDLLGNHITYKKGLNELTTKEFEEFLLQCISLCNEYLNMNLELYTSDVAGTLLTNKRN